MQALLQQIGSNWALFGWGSLLVAFAMIGSIVLAGVVVVRLPANYGEGGKLFQPNRDAHPVLRWTGTIARNVAGFLLIGAGSIMLFTPGQGLLTILIGLLLVDFPGKPRLVQRILRRPGIRRSINALRARFGAPPLS